MDKEIIKEIIETWLNDIPKKKIINRPEIKAVEKFIDYKHITTLSGVRRSGKTYILFQLINKLRNNTVYINFEDERFSDNVNQLSFIYETFLEYKNPTGKLYFFLDEIQNINGWEKWIAKMYEKNIKFFISGSNASLLSSEFSKSLTGRHTVTEIFPLSFREFLLFKDKEILNKSAYYIVEKRAKIKNLFHEYLRYGGFPEVIYDGKKDILLQYFNDILTKDIILRHNIKFKASLKEVALLLITNISSLHSLYSLNKIIQARSINTIKNYVMFMEEAHLLFKIPYFSFSIKKQLANPFKIYCVDNGLRNAASFRFSEDMGKIYENIVAIELIRRYKKENIFYWKKEDSELDFLIKQGINIRHLIQVCYDTKNQQTKKREIKSLLGAMKEFKVNVGTIITDDQEGEEKINSKKIKYIPLWKWLLEKDLYKQE